MTDPKPEPRVSEETVEKLANDPCSLGSQGYTTVHKLALDLRDERARVEELEAEMGRLREALKFYANEGNYRTSVNWDPVLSQYSSVQRDGGNYARKAFAAGRIGDG